MMNALYMSTNVVFSHPKNERGVGEREGKGREEKRKEEKRKH
jgi:hypothetical protein